MHEFKRHRTYIPIAFGIIALLICGQGFAQSAASMDGQALYDALKNFELQSKATVSNLKLKRDRGEMTFTGDFYFAAPVNGKVTGAVFIGEGAFRAEPPPLQYEKDSLKRFLNSEAIESEFKTAVLRFTDDTFDIIGKGSASAGAAPDDALDLAKDFEPRLLEETGANISARLAISISNNESPGFFIAQFDKGELDRFTFLIDPQCRILNYIFRIDAGEKVAVFRYDSYAYNNDLWIATYSEQDFENNRVSYSSDFDLVDPKHYKMEIDVTKARREVRNKVQIDFVSLADDLRAIPMVMNESITAYDDKRLNDSMRVETAQLNGESIPCVQEDWESGLTFLLPEPMNKGDEFSIEVSMAGDVIDNQQEMRNTNYPEGTSSWYPRHGFLKRSTFDLVFRHSKADLVVSVGDLVREEVWPDDDGDRLTEYKMNDPIPFASFVAGLLVHYPKDEDDVVKFGDMDINFYSLPTSADLTTIKEEFVMTELKNALEYFSAKFGPYPYSEFRSTFRPRSSRQAFATLVTLPGMDSADRNSFLYIGSATSQQWWGNVITMRSYRDQWLREGLVQYSGLLYVLARMQNIKEQKEFLDIMRYNMKNPPRTDTGIGKGKIGEIGPVILGRRLRTRNSMNSDSMVNDKGPLVIRMLHYIFSNPTSGDDSLFFEMLKDFTNLYAFKAASTDDFQRIANKHFPKTAVAQMFGLKDLNWFFQQWLYEAKLPSYKMEYSIESAEGGQYVIAGKIIQENAPKHWFMPLPVVLKFPGDQQAKFMVWANGPETQIQAPPLPMKPESVELDPDWWILSEKTETKKK
ncbi:MAG: M1 family aminopeptidase [Acidobacteriota bacterium]